MEGHENACIRGVPVTFIGAQVWCNGCKTVGRIGAKGPHRPASMRGKQHALDGDICLCQCTPPPIICASQDQAFHSFQPHELEETGSRRPSPSPSLEPAKPRPAQPQPQPPVQRHAQRVYMWDSETGLSLGRQPYIAELESGERLRGHTDDQGIATIETDTPQSFRIHLVFAAPKRALTPSQGA
jgi:uncharacterized Zn-binding protein involved in type VI secretion